MNYEEKPLSLNLIELDENNPRFEPVHGQDEAFAAMLKDMREKEKVLAKHIVENGLNPSSKIITFEKEPDKKYIVKDGNRRIVALKLIENPSKALPEDKSYYENLNNSIDKGIFNKIPCVIFKEEDETKLWIRLIHDRGHGGAGSEPWSAEQKDRFDNKKTKFTLFKDFIRKNNINDNELDKDTTERLFSIKDFLKDMGFSFKKNEMLISDEDKLVENLNNFFKFVKEMKQENKPNTRTLGTKEDRIKWYNNNYRSQNGLMKEETEQEPIIQHEKEKKRKKLKTQLARDREYLIPDEYRVFINPRSDGKPHDIMVELQQLNINEFTNAVAVLFRSFIELTIRHYIRKNKLPTQDSKGDEKSLADLIKDVCNHLEENNHISSSDRQEATSNRHKISIPDMNRFVHHPNSWPNEKQLITSWEAMKLVLEKCWTT